MTVRRLGTECDSKEITEWMAMERIEPFGPQIEDLRAAFGPAAIINNIRRMFGGADAELVDMRDLIPWYVRAPDKLLFDPAAPGYDKEAHAQALHDLFARAGQKKGEQ
jgi:hypothetical protein